MPDRFTTSVLLANIVLLNASFAQKAPCPPVSTSQIVSDVVVQGSSMNDGYGGWPVCGVGGQVYRKPDGGDRTSVMRVSRDGSTLLFSPPEHGYPVVIAAAGSGLNVLSSVYSTTERRVHFQMYHFDGQASLLAQNPVTIPIQPYGMAVMSSGRTIVLGTRLKDPDDDRK